MSHFPLHPNIQDPYTLGMHHIKCSEWPEGTLLPQNTALILQHSAFHLNGIKTLLRTTITIPPFFFSGVLLAFLVHAQCK